MHEVICSTCGAINQADAEICWRCLATIRETAAADAQHADGAKRNGGTKTVTRPKA